MFKSIMLLCSITACFFLLSGCEKKPAPPVVEENLIPDDELDMLDDAELESVEEDLLKELEEEEDRLTRKIVDGQEDELEQEVNREDKQEKPIKKTAKKLEKPEKKQEISQKPISSTRKPKLETNNNGISFSKTGDYVVQVSIFKDHSQAADLEKELKEQGFPAYISEITDPVPALSGTYYRVRIGAFGSINEADEFGKNVLKPQNYSYWVDRKSNDSRQIRTSVKTSKPAEKIIKAPVPSKKTEPEIQPPESAEPSVPEVKNQAEMKEQIEEEKPPKPTEVKKSSEKPVPQKPVKGKILIEKKDSQKITEVPKPVKKEALNPEKVKTNIDDMLKKLDQEEKSSEKKIVPPAKKSPVKDEDADLDDWGSEDDWEPVK